MPPGRGASRVQRRVPGARLTLLAGLGHLAHEEDAVAVMAALAPALTSLAPLTVSDSPARKPG